jgi:hypothetical protein
MHRYLADIRHWPKTPEKQGPWHWDGGTGVRWVVAGMWCLACNKCQLFGVRVTVAVRRAGFSFQEASKGSDCADSTPSAEIPASTERVGLIRPTVQPPPPGESSALLLVNLRWTRTLTRHRFGQPLRPPEYGGGRKESGAGGASDGWTVGQSRASSVESRESRVESRESRDEMRDARCEMRGSKPLVLQCFKTRFTEDPYWDTIASQMAHFSQFLACAREGP